MYKENEPEAIIPLDEIRENISQHEEALSPVQHKEVLTKLISKIEPLDFRVLAEFKEEKETLKKKHYLISSIEHILKLAKSQDWGLSQYHSFIYLFNGAYWDLLETNILKSFLGEAAEKTGIDKFDAKHFAFRDQLYKQFLALADLPKKESSKDKTLINLKNGTFEIDVTGMRLRRHQREDFLTYQLPFEYNPSAKAPQWEAFLEQALPDPNAQNILAEYIGYVFAKNLKLEKCIILFGPGGNGKSVFFDVINALLGKENISNYPLQNLTDEHGYYRAALANKLLNYASEINASMEAAVFKQLVSGEPVSARSPYGVPFNLDDYARLMFNCNILPREVEHTNAFFRRFIIIPFTNTIPEDKQDKQLAQKVIASELSGVFNWVLEGLNRLLKQKNFTSSDLVKVEMEKFMIESDSVKLFLSDAGYQKDPTLNISLKELYDEYRRFCIEDGYKSVSKGQFRKRLEASKIEIKKINTGNVVYVTIK